MSQIAPGEALGGDSNDSEKPTKTQCRVASEAKFREMSNFRYSQRVVDTMRRGRQNCPGTRSQTIVSARSSRLNINKAEASVHFVSRWVRSYERDRASARGFGGSASVIIANKILITQECSVSPCKINPQPGPLSRFDQEGPQATARHPCRCRAYYFPVSHLRQWFSDSATPEPLPCFVIVSSVSHEASSTAYNQEPIKRLLDL